MNYIILYFSLGILSVPFGIFMEAKYYKLTKNEILSGLSPIKILLCYLLWPLALLMVIWEFYLRDKL